MEDGQRTKPASGRWFSGEIYQTDTILALTDDMGSYPTEPAATCPGCQRRMAATDRKPILFTDCLVDVTYMCEWCGTQTKRAVREPVRPAHAGHARNADRRGLVA
jgi:hypothetical protein